MDVNSVKLVGCFRCLEWDSTKCISSATKPVNSHPSLNKITVVNLHIEGGLLILMQPPAEELDRKITPCFVVQSLRSVSLTGGSMRNAVWRTVTVIKYQQNVSEVMVLNNSSEQQHC